MIVQPRRIASAYFDAWRARDLSALRALLADDVSFEGPLAILDNADDCVRGLAKMASATEVVTLKVFVDGPDVLTWFELRTPGAPPIPTCNWSHIEGGKITRIRVAFDPRALLARMPTPAAAAQPHAPPH